MHPYDGVQPFGTQPHDGALTDATLTGGTLTGKTLAETTLAAAALAAANQPQAARQSNELSEATRGRAEHVGRRWAAELRAAIVSEKRRAAGGWPGTLREARTHVAISLIPWLRSNGQAAVTSEQCEGAARVVYASARKVWLENRDADDED
jgi:hypothetical protein